MKIAPTTWRTKITILVLPIMLLLVGATPPLGAQPDQPKTDDASQKAEEQKARRARARTILQNAREEAEKIADAPGKAFALADIAAAYIRAGDRKAALHLATLVKPVHHKTEIFRQIAVAQAGIGHLGTALITLKQIDKRFICEKTETLAQIAVALLEAGKRDDASRALEQAVKLSLTLKTNDLGTLPALRQVAWSQARLGDIKGALKTTNLIGRLPDNPDTVRSFYNHALLNVAEAQADAGDIEGAIKTTGLMKPPALLSFSGAFVAIARGVAAKGEIKLALTYIELLNLPEQKLRAMAEVANRQTVAGNKAAAKETCREALQMAGSISNPVGKAMGLGFVSKAQAKAGDIEGALKTAHVIAELEAKGGGVGFCCSALAEIGLIQARGKDLEGANKTFALALKIALGNKLTTVRDFEEVASAQAMAADDQNAIAWTTKLDSPRGRTYALLGVANGLIKREQLGKGAASDSLQEWVTTLGGKVQVHEYPPPNISIDFWQVPVTDENLKRLAKSKGIQSLILSATKITDVGLKELASCNHLTFLDLTDTKITDEGLKELKGCVSLHYLHLKKTGVTDTGLETLSVMQKLKYLNLSGTKVTGAGLKSADLNCLTDLFLGGSASTDESLKTISKLTTLECLFLEDTQVSDAGLRELPTLKKLHSLNLSRTKVTDAGFASLIKFKQLKLLALTETQVTDASVPNLLQLTELEVLWLEKTRVTDDGLRKLQTGLPKCTIYR